ncbi:hypothetical protein [Faecalibaculum rodentium]|uniref:CARDB domain-containing protein n=1 Tax=Faecalibaculum rodentium TaxID=1702221 RepID=A0A140DRR3_9FIRM|nr:hypothetical protein [Faecalibaculum rodentium]AMK53340.1 hypothetical protein AALO17_02060 [Faecalibaculum rodentium]
MESAYRTQKRLSALALAALLAVPVMPVMAQNAHPQPERETTEETKTPATDPADTKNPGTDGQDQKENLAGLVSISDIRVFIEGKESDAWEKGQRADLKLTLTSPRPTSAFTPSQPGKDPENLAVTRLSDAFKGGTPVITLASQQDKPLRLEVTFEDVAWRGKEDNFAFTLETAGGAARKDVRIYEVSEKEADRQDPEQNPENGTQTDPGTDGGDAYGGFGGSYGGEGSEPVKIQTATPHIIISKYTYGGESVQAGKKFDLSIEFRNTSKSLAVENILMSVETEEGLTITNSSNTFFFENLGAGAVRSQKIPMKALNMDKSSSPSCTVSFTYEYVDGDQRLEKTAQERIAIPVTEPDRFELEAPKDLTPAVAGQEYTLSVPYNNKGKGTVYNLEAYVEGDMTTLSPKQNLGNIDSGRSGSIDLILTPQEAGDHTFKAVIAWENTAGEEVKKSFELTLPVQENIPTAPEGGEMMPMEEETPSIPWGWLAAGLIVLAAAAFWWLRSRKKKKATLAKPGDVTALFDNPEPENSDSKDPKSGPDSHETL